MKFTSARRGIRLRYLIYSTAAILFPSQSRIVKFSHKLTSKRSSIEL